MSIRVMIVDDERPAIRVLEFMLHNYSDIVIIGTYTNPLAAYEDIIKLKPDVIFLDVNMPQLRGLDAASNILDVSPNTDIIFVTAYDQYAVEAFELDALDYLLKPFSEERLNTTVIRIRKQHMVKNEHRTQKLFIKCLGTCLLSWENREPMKFRTEKTRELFIYLLHNRNHNITKEEILNHIWSEDNPERAIRQLYNDIYYIRKALENYGVNKQLISINSSYNMKIVDADIDIDNFYRLGNNMNSISQAELEKMEALYTGEYLQGEDHLWVYSKREEVLRLYLACLIRLSKLYIANGEFEKAENRLLKAYGINPYEESTTEELMNLYSVTGRMNIGVKHYNSYVRLIKKDLGIKPSDKLVKLYDSILSK